MRKILNIPLHWQILAGAIVGFLLGMYSESIAQKVSILGALFLRALQMLVAPLILTSIVCGVTRTSGKSIGRMAVRTFIYYIFTSLLAILTGQILVNLIQPGKGVALGFREVPEKMGVEVNSIKDLLLRIIPTNPFHALSEGNMLQIIFIALILGFFVTRMKNENLRKTIDSIFQGFFDIMMDLANFIIKLAPLGIFGLIAETVGKSGVEPFKSLILYVLTVILGLIIHSCITLPLIQYFAGKKNPFKLARTMAPALLTAFSTSSSSATLPVTLERAEKAEGISNRIASFVLPLGATINMDGTALYECVAAIFIAQVYGIHLPFHQQIIVVFTALIASIGAAGIPMAGLVMLVVILKAVGLPLEGIGIILAVDRFLDMLRTATNVWSDITGATVISRLEGQ